MDRFLTNSEEAEWATGKIEEMILSIPDEVDAANVAALVVYGLTQLLVQESGYSPQAVQGMVTDAIRSLIREVA